MSTPTIKLTYFPIEAAAEKVRLTLVMTDTPFEDNRIAGEAWEALKPSTPYGQMPILEIDGKVMAQSPAMMRMIAKRFGGGELYPDALFVEIEEVLALSDDLARAWSPNMYIGMRPENLGHKFENDDDKKAKVKEMREKFAAEDLPKFLTFFTKIIEKNGGAFFCGPQVTIADLQILPQLRYFQKGVADFVPPTALDSHPVVCQWIQRMMELPKIKAWYAPKA
eukprot:CAMPEP_0180462302 /NCGR_PEP_ID=MMETSP1036_2-20121128/24333_1 /TAXON_ID=632150 /ORGANISM="Azadinium spinosum, Strain 3D9" /LENGTH=222 /DNA_ID=CAMNT_0022469067 /DNA_START=68 /DNA_END=736 /DNA_ORIENTATION=+